MTGLNQWQDNWDFSSEYPVLAVRISYCRTGTVSSSAGSAAAFYAKDTFFLTADKNFQFNWLSPSQYNLIVPSLSKNYYPRKQKRLTRYSVTYEIGDEQNMIIPVRQFSITNIELEGFDPGKEYPVLAVDIDKFIPETQKEAGEEETEQVPEPESVAFFLVANDNREFNWVAESECRLFPLADNKPEPAA